MRRTGDVPTQCDPKKNVKVSLGIGVDVLYSYPVCKPLPNTMQQPIHDKNMSTPADAFNTPDTPEVPEALAEEY